MTPIHSPLLKKAKSRTLTTPDGVRLAYQVLGTGSRTMILANGLGGRLYAWEPILETFAKTHRIITWDYRGLFGSRSASLRKLSVRDHAEDARAVMDAERVGEATMVGWSMGVQVILEFAHVYPDRARELVLINGTFGDAFATSFQPFFTIPGLDTAIHELIIFLKANHSLRDAIARLLDNPSAVDAVGKAVSALRGNPRITHTLHQYMHDVLGRDFSNYLHLFQELDSHSAYHFLHEIDQRTLLIAGGLDVLTPARQTLLMGRIMPRAELFLVPFGTHFVLLEYPARVTARIRDFLDRREG